MTITLRVAHLYPRLMNIYGDRGNIMCLRRRCEARGIGFELTELGMRDRFEPLAHDLIFAGGAQDREQRGVADDLLATKADAVREAVESDVAMLAVCGAYQLFGRFYREASGAELPGIGVFDLHTEHPGVGAKRLIGNIVAECCRRRRRAERRRRHDRRVRESWGADAARAGGAAAGAGAARVREQRRGRHGGGGVPERDRDVRAWIAAAEESGAGGLCDRRWRCGACTAMSSWRRSTIGRRSGRTLRRCG